jgi:hypothetical protein
MVEKRYDETVTQFTMRKIREEIIEECAQVAESIPDKMVVSVGKFGYDNQYRLTTPDDVARAIRRLVGHVSTPEVKP